MSISINSFTPTSAVSPENGVITFFVNASSSLGQSLNYQWQKSDDGIIWQDLPGEIYTNYTTPALTLAYNGDYYRVKVYTIGTGGLSSYTEYGPDANGAVVTVTTAVSLVFVTPLEPSYSVNAGSNLSMVVECSLTPSNSATQTNVSTISLQWQFSDNGGITWSNVPASQYSSLTESVIPAGTTGAFVKASTFIKSSVTTEYNQRRYRVIATSSLATSPSTSSSAVVLISSSITITKQPGTGSDITTCFKYLPSQPTTTGKLRLSVDATSSAGSFSNLSYQWYYAITDPNIIGPISFSPFNDGRVDQKFTAIGAQQKTLNLTEVNWVGSDVNGHGLKFYCQIEGTSGETSVYTDIATVIIEQSVVVDQHVVSSLSVVEDIYGDIPDRDAYIEAVQNATFLVSLLESPAETPLEGTAQTNGFPITIQWQRKNPDISANISGQDITISSTQSYTISGTSYPVRGVLWVPTGLSASSIDVVVCYHPTISDSATTILQSANNMMSIMKNNVGIKDKIIFCVAYPQDAVTVAQNINLLTAAELSNFKFGDNLPYARAALLWAKNNLNGFMSSNGITKTINKVFMFGHSQGGSLVHKLNTLEQTNGAVANAPGPIRLDLTCSAVEAVYSVNISCNKLFTAYGTANATPLTSNQYYQRSMQPYVTGHLAPITYLQALDDPTGVIPGNPNSGQPYYMTQLTAAMTANAQPYTYISLNNNGSAADNHAAFVTNNTFKQAIKTVVESTDNSSVWNNVGNLVIGQSTSTYVTPPLKRTIDNGAYYRAEISAANANNLPYYSPNSTGAILNVFNWLYISSQPAQSVVFVNQVASFAVAAIASTSTLTISYQWQYKTPSSATWINLTNNAQINGATTNLLIISNVTLSMNNFEFRCVVNTTDTLSSVTSSSAILKVSIDSFTSISSLNDQYLLEFQSLTWTVIAQSASLGAITYQWEKSNNYNASNPSAATWNNIAGATSATYTKGSISASDAGHYRCKLTSAGGTIRYTNVARLYVTSLNYSIITNFPPTLKILEGQQPASGIAGDSISFPYNFSIVANPTISTPTTYQWQYSVDSGANWINYGPSSGYLSSDPDEASFIPQPFNRSQSGIQIRCKVISTDGSIPGIFYSAVCIVTVDRRFYYNAGPATLVEKAGNEIRLNLNNYQTGGAPSFQWQRNTGSSWSDIVSLSGYSGETSNELVITPAAVTTSINGHKFRCIITLSNQDSHEYFRSGLQKIVISPAGNPTPTAEIAFSIQSADLKKAQYSELASRTGAAIGTVVCIPKPDGYTEGKTGDDTTSWLKQATGTSQGMYDTRFPGFVPLGYHSATSTRPATGAQLLNASHCPDLARIMGNVFGGNIVATYITSGYLPPITNTLPNPVSGNFGIPNNAGKKLMGTGSVNNNSSSASVVPRYDPLGSAGGAINIVGSTGGQYNYEKLDQLPPPTQGGPSGGLAGINSLTPATFTLGTFTTTGWGDDTITEVPTTYTETVNYTMGTLANAVLSSATLHSHSMTSFSYVSTTNEAWFTTVGSLGGTSSCKTVAGEDGEFLPGPALNSGGNAGYDVSNTNFSHRHGISDPNSDTVGAEGAGHGDGTGGAGNESLSSSFNQLDSSSTVSSGEAKLTTQSNAIWNSNLKFTLQNSDLIPINQKHFRLKYMIKAW